MLLRNAIALLLLLSSGMHASDALAGLMKKRAEEAMRRHLAERDEREAREREEAVRKRAQEIQEQLKRLKK